MTYTAHAYVANVNILPFLCLCTCIFHKWEPGLTGFGIQTIPGGYFSIHLYTKCTKNLGLLVGFVYLPDTLAGLKRSYFLCCFHKWEPGLTGFGIQTIPGGYFSIHLYTKCTKNLGLLVGFVYLPDTLAGLKRSYFLSCFGPSKKTGACTQVKECTPSEVFLSFNIPIETQHNFFNKSLILITIHWQLIK